jgi:hypothetical protein
MPEVAERFLAGEEHGFIDLSAQQGRVRGVSFENRATPAAFGEQDFGDVVKRIDAGYLVDFLADQMDGLWIGDESDAHSFGGWRLLITGRLIGTPGEFPTPILERSAATITFAATITRAAAIALAAAITLAAIAVAEAPPAIIGSALIATGRTFVGLGIGLGRMVLLVASGACPCRAEREAGQKFAHWVVFRMAHGAHSKEGF